MQNDLFLGEKTPEFFSLTGETVGVDEVGRGPLIGDVVAAAVILPVGCQLPLKDSKKLSESKRNVLAEAIKEQAIAYAIAVATPAEIDELNILQATMLAMQRAIFELIEKQYKISLVYVDGNRCPQVSVPCQSVVKGDDKVMEISAASILAKVYRDQQMFELHKQYPEYGFDQHKGYPTAKHLLAIQQNGLIEGYRKSFKPVKKMVTTQR
ncbi:Ribonuclease HII [hydrothermal vent metagenome]|uniref:Ribonuclease HII n=1 Tax=hydrothermal vent metagenome TaxID=652676 RepID=A0A3B0WWR1_9ZZZZ